MSPVQRARRSSGPIASVVYGSLLSVLSAPAVARGAEGELWPRVQAPEAGASDGAYGRFDGDTDLGLKLGGALSQSELWGSVGASAHYYSMVGASIDYSNGLSNDATDRESLSIGAELRPLFLPRWALDLERGPAWLDLSLDSLTFGLGAYWADPGSGFGDSRGVWLSVGLGVPLSGSASGPWIELKQTRRFPDRNARDEDAHSAFYVYFGWHQLVDVRGWLARGR